MRVVAVRKAAVLAASAAALLVGADAAAAAPGAGELDLVGGWHIVSTRSDLGKPQSFAQVPADGGLLGLRLGYFVFEQLSIEAEAVIIPTHAAGDPGDLATMLGYRLQLVLELVHVRDLGLSLSLVAGGGGLTVDASDKNFRPGPGGIDAGTVIMPQAGLSARVALGRSWGVRFDGRVFFVPASDLEGGASLTPDWEASGGVYVLFGAPGARRAARVHEPARVMVPAAPVDSDGDGLVDARDPCPDRAEDRDGFQDDDGCPDPDNDADGLADAADMCPVEAEDKDGYKDEDGCPDADNDSDGLLDSADKCPNEGEDKDGFEDGDGCPDPDNDRDGVLDGDDKCPASQETRNGFQDNDGCADTLPRAVARYTGVIPGINFATGKATITKGSFRVLDAAVKVLKDYPDLKLEIGGHTDDVGDAESNKQLSQERAQAVKDYMIVKGIAAERVRAVGYGQEKPLIERKSKKARAKNRRVEFQLITD